MLLCLANQRQDPWVVWPDSRGWSQMFTLCPILSLPSSYISSGQRCGICKNEPRRPLRHARGSTSELGDKRWLSCWGFQPHGAINLGRTRWVSNLWGLLKKTWLPQSYHPSATEVFDPIFSSSSACYLITFRSQSEEMMNGGLCGRSFLGLAKSQWWVREQTCGLVSVP